MRRLPAKLAFLHRALWQRDRAYRWAVLLGPPPVLGCALAALAWVVLAQVAPGRAVSGVQVPWARWTRPVPQEGEPFAEAPTAPLPPTDASGRYVGFGPGWQGGIQPVVVDATKDADVLGTTVGTFTLDQPAVPLARILDAGPQTGLFVGVARTSFVVPVPGLYAFSVRLTRSDTRAADCLMRMGSIHHRMVRSITLNVPGRGVLNYPATEFQLQPGLFSLAVAVGCWRGNEVLGAGDLIVMVRRPGDAELAPAAADELIRPVRAGGDTAPAGAGRLGR